MGIENRKQKKQLTSSGASVQGVTTEMIRTCKFWNQKQLEQC